MRDISEAFTARLAADDTTLCACWRFTRADGASFGATDHDVAIVFDDVVYEPAAGLESVSFETSARLAPGRGAGIGALSLAFIAERDLKAGLWDGCRVDVWRVDWRAPEHCVAIWSGRLSEVSWQGQAFAAELVSLKADLERPIGRVYARNCDAEVGDARCGVDLSRPEFRGEGTVSSLIGPKSFGIGGLDGFDDGWFAGGMLSWASGANSGTMARVVSHTSARVALAAAPAREVGLGDAFVVAAGCDKSFLTCGAKFANRVSFRGFPHMPGADAVLAGPSADRPNDGGRRR